MREGWGIGLASMVQEPPLEGEDEPGRFDRLDLRATVPPLEPLDRVAYRGAAGRASCQRVGDGVPLVPLERLPLLGEDRQQAVRQREPRIPDRFCELVERRSLESFQHEPRRSRAPVVLLASDHVRREILARVRNAVGGYHGRGVRVEEPARFRIQHLREIRQRMVVAPLRSRIAAVDRIAPGERGVPPRHRRAVQVPDVPVGVGIHEVHVGDREPPDRGLKLLQRPRANHRVELREPAAIFEPGDSCGERATLAVQPHHRAVMGLPEPQPPLLAAGHLHGLGPGLRRPRAVAVAVRQRLRRLLEPLDVQVADVRVVVRVRPAEPRVAPHVGKQEPEPGEAAEHEPRVAVEVDFDVALDSEERLVRVDEQHRGSVRRSRGAECPLVRAQRDVAQRAMEGGREAHDRLRAEVLAGGDRRHGRARLAAALAADRPAALQ